jgi:hypothetical protein
MRSCLPHARQRKLVPLSPAAARQEKRLPPSQPLLLHREENAIVLPNICFSLEKKIHSRAARAMTAAQAFCPGAIMGGNSATSW